MANEDTKVLSSRGNPRSLREKVAEAVADGWEITQKYPNRVVLVKPKKSKRAFSQKPKGGKPSEVSTNSSEDNDE